MANAFYERMGLPEPRSRFYVYCEDSERKAYKLEVEGTTVYDVKTKVIHASGFRPGSKITSVEKIK